MEVRFFFKPNFNAALVFVKESYSSSKLGSSLTQEDPLCYLPGRALIRVEPGGPRHSYESLSRVGLCSPQTLSFVVSRYRGDRRQNHIFSLSTPS